MKDYDAERDEINQWYLEQMRLLYTPHPTWAVRAVDAVSDWFARTPPFSWLDALLRGPVTPGD